MDYTVIRSGVEDRITPGHPAVHHALTARTDGEPADAPGRADTRDERGPR